MEIMVGTVQILAGMVETLEGMEIPAGTVQTLESTEIPVVLRAAATTTTTTTDRLAATWFKLSKIYFPKQDLVRCVLPQRYEIKTILTLKKYSLHVLNYILCFLTPHYAEGNMDR
jgi:hypothetical protein